MLCSSVISPPGSHATPGAVLSGYSKQSGTSGSSLTVLTPPPEGFSGTAAVEMQGPRVGVLPLPQIQPLTLPSLSVGHSSSARSPPSRTSDIVTPATSSTAPVSLPHANQDWHRLPAPMPPSPGGSLGHVDLSKEISLTLHDGPLVFTLAELNFVYLLNPPTISLAKAPAVLWKAWDDSQGQSSCTSPLIIKGRKIAMKYWNYLLQQIGGNHWSQCKQAWGKLKVRDSMLQASLMLSRHPEAYE
jgi:hypothetical protein